MFGPNYGSIIFCDQLWKWRIKHLFCLSSASSYTHVFNFLSFFIFHGRCVFSYKTYDSNNTPIFERLLYSWVNSWYYWELLNVELEATTEWLLTLWGRTRAFFLCTIWESWILLRGNFLSSKVERMEYWGVKRVYSSGNSLFLLVLQL